MLYATTIVAAVMLGLFACCRRWCWCAHQRRGAGHLAWLNLCKKVPNEQLPRGQH
jgi:hypothetical protein